MNWLKLFDKRQQKEIRFSQVYVNEFEHGTDGHNAKVIIAKTTKGKGVSFFEGKLEWHYKTIDQQHYQKALTELNN